jgi:PAS domain S-box-containing protein
MAGMGRCSQSNSRMIERLHAASVRKAADCKKSLRPRPHRHGVDGIRCIDATGRAELFNPAREHIFSYSADEVLGGNISMLMPPKYRGHHEGRLRAYGIGREVEGRRKNGDVLPIDLSVEELSRALRLSEDSTNFRTKSRYGVRERRRGNGLGARP